MSTMSIDEILHKLCPCKIYLKDNCTKALMNRSDALVKLVSDDVPVRYDYIALAALRSALSLNGFGRNLETLMEKGVVGDMSTFKTIIATKNDEKFLTYIGKGGYIPPKDLHDFSDSEIFGSPVMKCTYLLIIDKV